MSIALVNREISAFLKREAPEVLCVRGKWGVGKTYTWNAQLTSAAKAGVVGLKRYSYVSLFGVNSLEDLRFSIFENVVNVGMDGLILCLRSNYLTTSTGAVRLLCLAVGASLD